MRVDPRHIKESSKVTLADGSVVDGGRFLQMVRTNPAMFDSKVVPGDASYGVRSSAHAAGGATIVPGGTTTYVAGGTTYAGNAGGYASNGGYSSTGGYNLSKSGTANDDPFLVERFMHGVQGYVNDGKLF